MQQLNLIRRGWADYRPSAAVFAVASLPSFCALEAAN
jgi:hypothetical protein